MSIISGNFNYVVVYSGYEERLKGEGVLDELKEKWEYSNKYHKSRYEPVAIIGGIFDLNALHTFRDLTEIEKRIVATIRKHNTIASALFKVYASPEYANEEDEGISLESVFSFISTVKSLRYASFYDLLSLKQFSTDGKNILIAIYDAESG